MSASSRNSVGTYVGVGANRSGHAARTAKAAQRTPLPPKGADARWSASRNATSDIIEAMLAEARALVAANRAAVAAEAAADAEPVAEETVEEVIEEPRAGTAEPMQPTPDAPKVGAYVDSARDAGWDTSYTYNDEQKSYVVTSVRGAESIRVTFVDGSWCPVARQIFRRADGAEVKLRNASAAKKQMLLDGEARPVRTVRRRAVAAPLTDAEDAPQRALPNGFLDLDDDDLVAVLRSGVRIVWRTPSSRIKQEATVVRGAHIKVEPNMMTGTKERRAVHFTDGATYRSVSLRSMLQIIPIG